MDEHYSEGQSQKMNNKIEGERRDTNRAKMVGIKHDNYGPRKGEAEDEMRGIHLPNEPLAMDTEKVVEGKIRELLKERDHNIPPTESDGKEEKSGDIKGRWKRLARDVTGWGGLLTIQIWG